MTLRGHVESGQIVLDEPAQLPDGAVVRIELIAPKSPLDIHSEVQRSSGILPVDSCQADYVDALAKKHL